MRKIFLYLVIAAAISAAVFAYVKRVDLKHAYHAWRLGEIPKSVPFENVMPPAEPVPPPAETSDEPPNAAEPVEPLPPARPESFNLAVPFVSQAPFQNWEQPYQDFCEEASILSVHEFYEGRDTVSAQDANDRMMELKETQERLFSDYKSTDAVQTKRLIQEQYGNQRVDIIPDPSIEDIIAHVRAGRPVIVPAAGRELGNPYFTPPGPLYHMLVIRGYTPTHFITNDVGTNTKGENFRYPFDTLMNAIHDWNGGDVYNGRRAVIVVWPNEQ